MIELPRQAPTLRRLRPVPCGRGAPRAYPAPGRRLAGEIPESQAGLPQAPKPRSWMPGNAALKCLAGSPLATRFHAWRGASGRRYVCSVFPLDPAAPDAGLPQFAGVVIAVARAADGWRRLVSMSRCEPDADPGARDSFVVEARAAGACEWHVHLLASEASQQRLALADLTAAAQGRRGKLA
jgi:hypothetical protein